MGRYLSSNKFLLMKENIKKLCKSVNQIIKIHVYSSRYLVKYIFISIQPTSCGNSDFYNHDEVMIFVYQYRLYIDRLSIRTKTYQTQSELKLNTDIIYLLITIKPIILYQAIYLQVQQKIKFRTKFVRKGTEQLRNSPNVRVVFPLHSVQKYILLNSNHKIN